MRVSVYGTFTVCVAAVSSENLLAGLGKCHPGKGRGEGFRVHLAARALQVIILPRLCVRRLKHQPGPTSSKFHDPRRVWTRGGRASAACELATLPGGPVTGMGHVSCTVLQTGDREPSDRRVRLKEFTYKDRSGLNLTPSTCELCKESLITVWYLFGAWNTRVSPSADNTKV